MDLEVLGEMFAKAEADADKDHWRACEIAFDAWMTGRDSWAWMLSKFSGKSDDQCRNRKSAWVMYLELIAETPEADSIKESLTFSHHATGYKYLWHRDMEGVRTKTDMTDLVELFITARDDEESVVAFSVSLDEKFGKDLQEKYFRQLKNWIKRGRKLWGMSEYNNVPQGLRFAMQRVIKESEKET